MSSFICEKCGVAILDSDKGYVTGCAHYYPELADSAFTKKEKEKKEERPWTHIYKRGSKVVVDGKESDEFLVEGIWFEVKTVSGDNPCWLIRKKLVTSGEIKRSWD